MDDIRLPVQLKIFFKSCFLLLLLYWSYQLIFTHNQWIFLDYANLIVHETGHLLFMWTSQFLYVLGGSLFQVAIPIVALLYFLFTRQKMAVIFSVFWIGNNIINISHYIKDARAMQLPLAFGGTIHDWHWILFNLGLLKYDQIIGNTVFGFGILFLVMSLILHLINILSSVPETR